MHRTTRRISLTDAGEQLYVSARRSFDDIGRTTEQIIGKQRKPLIDVSVSTYFSARWLSPRLGKFWEFNPEVQLRFHHDSDSDDIDPDSYDLAIRWGFGDWSGPYNVTRLFDAPMSAYCSPHLFEGLGRPPAYEDLRKVVLLSDKLHAWRRWFECVGIADPDLSNSRYIADPLFRVQTAVDGHGILLGDLLLQHELDVGDLICPFEAQVPNCAFYLLTKDERFAKSEVVLFRDWLIEEATDS